ncbi:hypothetical protein B0H17DRAFT_1197996 [Mycena rosella]|uniref:Uncharacterized protein n=1 Tax=Mycena rosella TaxID=1033263 RepID=A0AAD7DP92_MYCRO|nr:hypothetical protein B0H17DRAFT_1197996 [Mycena rosella]
MASITEASLSLVASASPTSTATKVLFGVLALTAATSAIHCASPTRLTRVLVFDIANTERTYLQAIEAGMLKSDVHIAENLTRLQITASTIREDTLRNSLSYRAALCAFFKGRSLTVMHCIRDVRALGTRIEILKEEQLRVPASENAMQAVSRRHRYTDSAKFYKSD